MTYQHILFEVKDGIARITMNRPDVFNALNLQMARDLMHAAIACDEDPAIRCVVLTGAGKAFGAGGDITGFAQAGDTLPALMKEMTVYFHAAISRFARMDAPLIAAVNGVAAGAGFSTMLMADVAIAAESARFTLAYTRAGLTPDGGSTYFLGRTVGLRRAVELALTNRALSAREALDWGIVNKVVPDADLTGDVDALARALAAGPTKAFGGAKRLLAEGLDATLETQMEMEARSIADMARSADGREGIAAFVAKRPPSYRGN
jgi:2-(1,2-epoxy-1,2-dihydrophenyl)acetyl-CoA isomerase